MSICLSPLSVGVFFKTNYFAPVEQILLFQSRPFLKGHGLQKIEKKLQKIEKLKRSYKRYLLLKKKKKIVEKCAKCIFTLKTVAN